MEEEIIQEELKSVSDQKADKSPEKVQAVTAETPETIKETPEKSPEKSPEKLAEKSTEKSPEKSPEKPPEFNNPEPTQIIDSLSSIGDDNLLNHGEFKLVICPFSVHHGTIVVVTTC